MALVQMTLNAFKREVGTEKIAVRKNPKTGKLFGVLDNGKTMRVQGDIDTSKEVVVLIEEGDLYAGCLINPGTGGAELVASF